MVEALFCVVYFIGMYMYFYLWVNLINHQIKHSDVVSITFQMAVWPVAFFWLCYKFNKGELK